MAGLLDIFGTGGVETMGLLGMSPEDIQKNRSDAQAQALYALAGRLFQGGRGGASIVEGLQQGQQAYKTAMQGSMQQQLQNAQVQEMLRKRQQEQAGLAEQQRVQQVLRRATGPETFADTPLTNMMGQEIAGPNMPQPKGMGLTQDVVNQLIGSQQGQTALGQMADLMPKLRRAGIGAEQRPEDNPFLVFTQDETIPKNVKTLAEQYSKSWSSGRLDPDVADKRFSELTSMAQRIQDKNISQANIEAAQAQTKAFQTAMTDLKERGLQNSVEYKQLQAQNTAALLALKTAASANKFLPASLQKSEDEDLQAINSYKATQKELFSPLKALTPDPVTKKPMLELGPVQNLRYQAANLSGDSTEASRAYADLQSSVKNAVNLKVSAEKGVQTDKDVLRFADALIAAYGRNDTKATLEALRKFNDSIVTAQENTIKLIEQRRKSQGVAPLYGDTNRNVNVNY
jgi:hypothetical protein